MHAALLILLYVPLVHGAACNGTFGAGVDRFADSVRGCTERTRHSCDPCDSAVALLDHVILIACDGGGGDAEYATERAVAAVARNLFARGVGGDGVLLKSTYEPPTVRTAVLAYTSSSVGDGDATSASAPALCTAPLLPTTSYAAVRAAIERAFAARRSAEDVAARSSWRAAAAAARAIGAVTGAVYGGAEAARDDDGWVRELAASAAPHRADRRRDDGADEAFLAAEFERGGGGGGDGGSAARAPRGYDARRALLHVTLVAEEGGGVVGGGASEAEESAGERAARAAVRATADALEERVAALSRSDSLVVDRVSSVWRTRNELRARLSVSAFVPTPADAAPVGEELADAEGVAESGAALLAALGDPLYAEEFANLDGFQRAVTLENIRATAAVGRKKCATCLSGRRIHRRARVRAARAGGGSDGGVDGAARAADATDRSANKRRNESAIVTAQPWEAEYPALLESLQCRLLAAGLHVRVIALRRLRSGVYSGRRNRNPHARDTFDEPDAIWANDAVRFGAGALFISFVCFYSLVCSSILLFASAQISRRRSAAPGARATRARRATAASRRVWRGGRARRGGDAARRRSSALRCTAASRATRPMRGGRQRSSAGSRRRGARRRRAARRWPRCALSTDRAVGSARARGR